jgi:hypothetical protein
MFDKKIIRIIPMDDVYLVTFSSSFVNDTRIYTHLVKAKSKKNAEIWAYAKFYKIQMNGMNHWEMKIEKLDEKIVEEI